MLISPVEKIALSHLGTHTWKTEERDSLVMPLKDGCVLVWFDKEQTPIPDLIVVADGEIQSFLAWTTTYIPHLCPLTALVQIAEHHTAKCEVERAVGRWEPYTDRYVKHLRGCLGLVNAEVAAAGLGTLAPFGMGLTPHLSTLSWLALQVHHLNANQPPRSVYEAWTETRLLLNSKSINYTQEIEEIWSIVTNTSATRTSKRRDESQQIREFVNAVAEGDEIDHLPEFVQSQAEAIQAVRTGPLEARMEIFRKLLRTLYGKDEAPASHAVVAGYALSQISQGSFSHIGLLGPDRVYDVRPLLWYGWFDFSRDNAEPSSSAVAAANLQLLKRLQELRVKPRRGNISLDELRVLTRLKEPFAECLLDVRHPVSVEITSGATTVVQTRLSGSQHSVRKRRGQPSLFDDIDN